MSKPNDGNQELSKISHGRRANSRKLRLRSKARIYNRECFDFQKLSLACEGDLAFLLDSDAKALGVNKSTCVLSESSRSGFREMTKCDTGANYRVRRTSIFGLNRERRKTSDDESDGIELRMNERTRLLFERNRELKKEIARRKVAEEQIRAVLTEKDLLLKEVRHRIKNNLQLITTVLDLHSCYTNDYRMQNVLTDIQNRIKSMALVHEQMYQSKALTKINFKGYVENLVNHIFESYGVNKRTIKPEIKGSDCSLCVKSVINCGLIANELISNALKHAFPDGRHGVVLINMSSRNNNFSLIVCDNGVGFPKNFSFQKIRTLGLQLVISLTHQLNGMIKLNRRGRTEFKIVIPENRERD